MHRAQSRVHLGKRLNDCRLATTSRPARRSSSRRSCSHAQGALRTPSILPTSWHKSRMRATLAAEKLSPCADLRGDGELLQPTVIELGTTRWVIEAGLERQQKVISKEKDRPFTEQQPLVRPVRRIAVGLHLVNDNRLNGKLVIWLNDSAVSEAERMRIRQTDSWPVDCSGEVRRVALAILQRQVVVST